MLIAFVAAMMVVSTTVSLPTTETLFTVKLMP